MLICNVNLQDLQKSQSLLASAQAELHHIKEKNMDLKRGNALLEQETLKVGSKYTNTHTLNVLTATVQTLGP